MDTEAETSMAEKGRTVISGFFWAWTEARLDRKRTAQRSAWVRFRHCFMAG
jgi:hypothetical protein